MKYIVFRFDVDTHKCMREGVPNLLRLAKKHKVKFTFFVNFGRSIDRLSFLQSKFLTKTSITCNNLSAFQKLGYKDYLKAALLNPLVGLGSKYVVARIIKEGHEVGLHGGRNHELWNREATLWNNDRIQSEIDFGLDAMNTINPKYKMKGFASPHWRGSSKIQKMLKKSGFEYISDIHTDKPAEKVIENNLPNIPVNISGEPGGVGYLEHARALQKNDSEILQNFKVFLRNRKKYACVYDHPYYSGIKELSLLSKMIKSSKSLGFEIVTMQKAFKVLTNYKN